MSLSHDVNKHPMLPTFIKGAFLYALLSMYVYGGVGALIWISVCLVIVGHHDTINLQWKCMENNPSTHSIPELLMGIIICNPGIFNSKFHNKGTELITENLITV